MGIAYLSAGLLVAAVYGLVARWSTARLVVFLAVTAIAIVGTAILASLRARTEIGPDGIRNRVLRQDVLIPWADIEDVRIDPSGRYRTVYVVRREGQIVRLAALRDGPGAPDPGFDDTVEAIRGHIAHTCPTETAETAPEPELRAPDAAGDPQPLLLRPPRRSLWWICPLMIGSAALWVLGAANGRVGTMLVVGGVAIGCARMAVAVIVGRTEVQPDGLRTRTFRKTILVPWDDAERLSVTPSLFGRSIAVIRKDGQRVALVAPREMLFARDPGFDDTVTAMQALAAPHRPGGLPVELVSSKTMRGVYGGGIALLIAFAVVFDAPWLEQWWPGRVEATQIPHACDIATTEVERILPGSTPERGTLSESDYSESSDCRWTSDNVTDSLRLELDLKRRGVYTSGTGYAREEVEYAMIGGQRPQRVTGLGDEARRVVRTVSFDEDVTDMQLRVRRANVIIDISYDAERPGDQVVADAESLARAVINEIRFD
jgi:hypothetical protein